VSAGYLPAVADLEAGDAAVVDRQWHAGQLAYELRVARLDETSYKAAAIDNVGITVAELSSEGPDGASFDKIATAWFAIITDDSEEA